MLLDLDQRAVKYVSVRDPDTYGETIIGKNGIINIAEGELIIVCEGTEVFRHDLDGLEAGEFLSHDGVNIRYINPENGRKCTIAAYYKYHRK